MSIAGEVARTRPTLRRALGAAGSLALELVLPAPTASTAPAAASAVLARVGGASLARLASEAGMSDYAPGVGWWAFTQTSDGPVTFALAVFTDGDPSMEYGEQTIEGVAGALLGRGP